MFNYNDLPIFPGFSVYDAETGEELDESPYSYWGPDDDAFFLDSENTLYGISDGFWIGNDVCAEVRQMPKGKYVIQIGDTLFKYERHSGERGK